MAVIHAFSKEYGIKDLRLLSEASVAFNGEAVLVQAQWDTGANGTSISKEVVQTLGLPAIGRQLIITPSGYLEAATHIVDIVLPGGGIVSDVEVCESEIGQQGLGILIGMDIISKGDFAVSNFDGRAIFSFRMPSSETTDYVEAMK